MLLSCCPYSVVENLVPLRIASNGNHTAAISCRSTQGLGCSNLWTAPNTKEIGLRASMLVMAFFRHAILVFEGKHAMRDREWHCHPLCSRNLTAVCRKSVLGTTASGRVASAIPREYRHMKMVLSTKALFVMTSARDSAGAGTGVAFCFVCG